MHHIVSILLEGLAKILSCYSSHGMFSHANMHQPQGITAKFGLAGNAYCQLQKHLSTVKPASNGHILLHCLYHVPCCTMYHVVPCCTMYHVTHVHTVPCCTMYHVTHVVPCCTMSDTAFTAPDSCCACAGYALTLEEIWICGSQTQVLLLWS